MEIEKVEKLESRGCFQRSWRAKVAFPQRLGDQKVEKLESIEVAFREVGEQRLLSLKGWEIRDWRAEVAFP